MRISFRQGIVSYANVGGQPDFLSVQPIPGGGGGNKVMLKTGNAPVEVAFAQGLSDYIYIEPQSGPPAGWLGPFIAGTDYWLYWDINKNTGIRTFGSTASLPVFGNFAPSSPVVGQHWFDTLSYNMKTWQGTAWIIVIRVFAAKLISGNVLDYTGFLPGSQVNVTGTTTDVGQILFDDNNKPVKKSNGAFFTTAEQFFTAGSVVNALSLDNTILHVFAGENIAQYRMVKLVAENQVRLATYEDTPDFLIAMTMTSAVVNDALTMIVEGVVTNPAWIDQHWNAGDRLWIDQFGTLTNVDPHSLNSFRNAQQFIGRVISADTIYLQPIGAPIGGTFTDIDFGLQTTWIPTAAMYPSILPQIGPTVFQVEINQASEDTLNVPQFVNAPFEIGTSMQFTIAFPSGWDLGPITWNMMWMVPTTDSIVGTACKFQLEAVAINGRDLLSIPFGTPVALEVDAVTLEGYEQHKTGLSAPLTIGGNVQVGSLCYFRITRVVFPIIPPPMIMLWSANVTPLLVSEASFSFMENVVPNQITSVAETWMIVAVSKFGAVDLPENLAPREFTVIGTISGPFANAISDVPYDNGIIAFTLTSGEQTFDYDAWNNGDLFTISVTGQQIPDPGFVTPQDIDHPICLLGVNIFHNASVISLPDTSPPE